MNAELGNRALLDFCMMSSKLSYENEKVIRNVVTLHWKACYSPSLPLFILFIPLLLCNCFLFAQMHFVDFYNCWNGK